MGHGTRNDDERDYERDYDQRQMGNQNEMASADREYASAEPSVLPMKEAKRWLLPNCTHRDMFAS